MIKRAIQLGVVFLLFVLVPYYVGVYFDNVESLMAKQDIMSIWWEGLAAMLLILGSISIFITGLTVLVALIYIYIKYGRVLI